MSDGHRNPTTGPRRTHRLPARTQSDHDLLARWAHDRDHTAFAELVGRHSGGLHSLAWRVLHNDTDADDAVQNAWSHAARAAGTFSGRAAVRTWLHRITVNAAVNLLRHHSSRPPLAPADQEVDRADPTPHPDDFVAARDHVAALLGTLTDDQRAAITLTYLHGLSAHEAADRLGVAEGTIKSRCSRARARMAAALAADDSR